MPVSVHVAVSGVEVISWEEDVGKNQLLTGLLAFVGDQASLTPFPKILMQGLNPRSL